MSFGFSPSDIATLISLTAKAYNGWKNAPAEYADIAQTLNAFRLTLDRTYSHFERKQDGDQLVPDEWLARQSKDRRTLRSVLKGSKSAVKELEELGEKFRGTSSSHLKRVRLGWTNVDAPLDRLARHMATLNTFLQTVELDSIDRLHISVTEKLDRLPLNISSAVTVAVGRLIDTRIADDGSARESLLSSHGDDDKLAWRELRRELRRMGISDSVIRHHRSRLKDFVASIVGEGDADAHLEPVEEEPASPLVLEEGSVDEDELDSKSDLEEASVNVCEQSDHSRDSDDDGQESHAPDTEDGADTGASGMGQGKNEDQNAKSQSEGYLHSTVNPHTKAADSSHNHHNGAERRISDYSMFQAYVESDSDTACSDDVPERGEVDGPLLEPVENHTISEVSTTIQEAEAPSALPSPTDGSDDSWSEVSFNASTADDLAREPFEAFHGPSTLFDSDEDDRASNRTTSAWSREASPTRSRYADSIDSEDRWSTAAVDNREVVESTMLAITYEPLDLNTEHRLVIKLGLPSGWFIEDPSSKIVQFKDYFAPNRSRSYYPRPPTWGSNLRVENTDVFGRSAASRSDKAALGCNMTAEAMHLASKCRCSFLMTDSDTGGADLACHRENCGLTKIEWNAEKAYWNPDLLKQLREWAERKAPLLEDVQSETTSTAKTASDLPPPRSKKAQEKTNSAEKSKSKHKPKEHRPIPDRATGPSETSAPDLKSNAATVGSPPPSPPQYAYRTLPPRHAYYPPPPPPPHSRYQPEPPPHTFNFSPNHGFGGFSDPKDIFAEFMRGGGDNDMFGNASSGSAKDSNRRDKEVSISIVEKPLLVSLEDIFKGVTKKLKVQRKAYNTQTRSYYIEDKILSVPIKRGLLAGSKIKYPDMGDQVDGAVQDLHLIIKDKPHPVFTREGRNIKQTVDITLAEAAGGWERQVATIDGKVVRLAHAGPTPSTWTETFPGLGMPKSKKPLERGDMIVGVRIVVWATARA